MAITPRSFLRNPLLLLILSTVLVAGLGFASTCLFTCDRQRAETEAIAKVRVEAKKAQRAANEQQAARATTEAVEPGWLGVKIRTVRSEQAVALGAEPTQQGAQVLGLQRNRPAEKAGIQRNDIITHFDGKKIRSACQLTKVVGSTPAGKNVQVRVLRDGVPMVLLPTLTERPADCGCKKRK